MTRSINFNGGLDFSYRTDQVSIALNSRLMYTNAKNDLKEEKKRCDEWDGDWGEFGEWGSGW